MYYSYFTSFSVPVGVLIEGPSLTPFSPIPISKHVHLHTQGLNTGRTPQRKHAARGASTLGAACRRLDDGRRRLVAAGRPGVRASGGRRCATSPDTSVAGRATRRISPREMYCGYVSVPAYRLKKFLNFAPSNSRQRAQWIFSSLSAPSRSHLGLKRPPSCLVLCPNYVPENRTHLNAKPAFPCRAAARQILAVMGAKTLILPRYEASWTHL